LATNGFGLKEMMQKRFIIALTVVSLLAGSVAGQKKYERPAVKTPDTFRGDSAVLPTD
jgi:general stress protein CsbA